MNRGFKTYFRLGKSETKKIFKIKGNLLKYYLYQLMNMLSYLIPFLHPVFALSGVRMARLAKQTKNIEVVESFETSNKPQSYWTTLLSFLIQFLIVLAGALLIAGAWAIVMFIVQSLISLSQAYELVNGVTLVVTIPFAIMLIAYLIVISLYFSPRNFYIDSVDNITVTDALEKSYLTMKQKSKRTVFAIKLIPYLIVIALVLLGIVLGETSNDQNIMMIIYTIDVVIIIFALPRLLLSRDIALISLYEDLMINKTNVLKSIDDVNVNTKVSAKGFKPASKSKDEKLKDELVKLFDDTEDIEYKPVEEPEFNELVDDDVKEDVPDEEEQVNETSTTELSNEENNDNLELNEEETTEELNEESSKEESTEETVESLEKELNDLTNEETMENNDEPIFDESLFDEPTFDEELNQEEPTEETVEGTETDLNEEPTEEVEESLDDTLDDEMLAALNGTEEFTTLDSEEDSEEKDKE